MKNALIGLAILAGISFAQDAQKNTPATPPSDGGGKPELRWLVSVWDLANPEQPRDLEHYVIFLDSNVMELNGKLHNLQDAGQDLSGMLDLIGAHTMRATAWWRHVENAAPDTQPNAAPDGSGAQDDKSKGPAKKDLPKLNPNSNGKIAQNE